MAKNYMDSSDLILSIRRRAMIPSSSTSTFSDDDLISMANEEYMIGLLPAILSEHEDYFLYSEDTALVANQSIYDIPTRAIGNKLRDLAYRDTNRNIFEMTRIPIDNVSDYQGTHVETRFHKYYVQGAQVVLLPRVSSVPIGWLIFDYYLRPNTLVKTDRIAVITAINPITGDVTVSSIPSCFYVTSSAPNYLKYDFVQVSSPHKIYKIDTTLNTIDTVGKVLNFAPADLPTGLSVGDHVCVAGETCIPQGPSELHVVLAHRVATQCLAALGDTEGLANATKKLAEMEEKTKDLISNRVEASPQKITNRHSILRIGRRGRRYY